MLIYVLISKILKVLRLILSESWGKEELVQLPNIPFIWILCCSFS